MKRLLAPALAVVFLIVTSAGAQVWWWPGRGDEHDAPSAEAPRSRPTPRARFRGVPAIGLLLPLSGRYAAFGDAVLRGARLALGAVDGDFPGIRTLVHDTLGELDEAVRGFRRFAGEPGVVAVIGPMLSWEVEALLAEGRSIDLPVFTFSQREVPPGGPVFRLAMTKEAQVRVLVDHALGEQGLRRWAIVHPRDSYGSSLARLFREEVARRGGETSAVVAYDGDQVDFQAEMASLRTLLGMSELTPRDRSEDSQAPLYVRPPIDGVFLPDSAENVVLVVPQLAFHDIRGVQLLGSDAWHDRETLARAGRLANGAIFVDGFFLHSFRAEVRDFVDAFRDAYGEDPDSLAAHGYDAAAIVRTLVVGGATDREALLTALGRSAAFSGATGVTRFTGDGEVEKDLFLLEVGDRNVREIERSGERLERRPRRSVEPTAPMR